MKSFAILSLLAVAFVCSSSVTPAEHIEAENSPVAEAISSFSQSSCTSSFDGNVHTYELMDNGSMIGHAVWISRKSQRVKAKYFAHKQYGSSVYDRYKDWRDGKQVALMSSGAYASSDLPVGVTVDYGNIVNKKYHNTMDGLVIVYATGGIAVSNIEDGDLYLAALDKHIDIRNSYNRVEFLNWAQSENATVFQTHLLIYEDALKFLRDNGEKARRKFLVLARSRSGELFHIIFYTKERQYTLYSAAQGILSYLNGQGMNVIAAVNLDTGMYDIMSTGEGARDCYGDFITGNNNNRSEMTNLLAYEFN